MSLHAFLQKVTPGLRLENNGSDLIRDLLERPDPGMIARFGSTEIKAILYPKLPSIIRMLFKRRVCHNMEVLSGFFPSNEASIGEFSRLMFEDMKIVDILGSWRVEEQLFKKQLQRTKIIPLRILEPYFQESPWTEALRGKKVLVIHPFNQAIERQYHNNRKNLFKDQRVLPEFKSLETIKAVQTIAGNNAGFSSWFDALDYMKSEIDKKDFDIAIIGCGAYGFPLAAHIKRIGKKAVHLGGATQILFGIKGKRWIEREDFKSIINEYFIFPEVEDKPENASKVEGGCYW